MHGYALAPAFMLALATLWVKSGLFHRVTLCPLCPLKADIQTTGQHVR